MSSVRDVQQSRQARNEGPQSGLISKSRRGRISGDIYPCGSSLAAKSVVAFTTLREPSNRRSQGRLRVVVTPSADAQQPDYVRLDQAGDQHSI